jgi:hypothetical protein
MDQRDAGILLVIEASGEEVAEHPHVHALSLEILQVVEDEIGI